MVPVPVSLLTPQCQQSADGGIGGCQMWHLTWAASVAASRVLAAAQESNYLIFCDASGQWVIQQRQAMQYPIADPRFAGIKADKARWQLAQAALEVARVPVPQQQQQVLTLGCITC